MVKAGKCGLVWAYICSAYQRAERFRGQEVIIHIQDAAELKYCIRGQKEFFKRHGLNFRKWVTEGLDEEEFLKTGDAMALRLVEYAKSKADR